ncbi:MAG: DUF5985 family protein [Terriglobales bacterium]
MRQFLWGMLTMATLIAGLFFLRYWKLTGERLFAFFSLAFAVMAVSWIGLAAVDPALKLGQYMYLIRLLAYIILIIGIIDKNSRERRR